MAKPIRGGGGGGSTIFTSNIVGDGLVSSELWIDLGLIPTGNAIWFGSGQYASPDKTIVFELRGNLATKSASTDADTELFSSVSVRARSGMVTKDYYRRGRLHLATVFGTGVEHAWLKLKSKGSSGSFFYSINYTTE